eukprot:jgi/Phyca11/531967/estExt2_fgenesh1_pg.C_PHYCAscaffold_30128
MGINSSKDKNDQPVAGENSLLQARVKAIKNARNYIYIEDQYFILVPELLEALMEVMARIMRLIVVVNVLEFKYQATGYGRYLYDMVSPLLKAYPNKFNIYTTKKKLNIYVHTMPDVDPTGAKTGFKEVFSGVVERGGDVNILGWANIAGGYMPYNTKARDAINSIPPSPINGAKAIYIFDDRVKLISSQHQKNMVIISPDPEDQPVAYVGGIDLANDRWDTIYHNNTAIRDAGHITYQQKGWVDGHIRIHGPAAKDVAVNFIDRWNSKFLPCQNLKQRLLDFSNPKYDNIPPLNYSSSNTTATLGNQSIQITRTFSCEYEHYKEFAPKGETSLLQARIKAIKNAKNFIYIEDQYFVLMPELLDALMEVMPRIQRVIVVTKEQTNPFTNAGYIKYLYQNVHPLRSKYPKKFAIYTTKAELDLCIHSKFVIIDDVYLSIGSANWNRRSMTADTELNADVVDGDTVESPEGVTVGKLPRDFRIRKFVEMTGLSYAELDAMTFVEAAERFAVAAADKTTILAPNVVKYHLYYIAITNFMRKISDPQDTCSADDR